MMRKRTPYHLLTSFLPLIPRISVVEVLRADSITNPLPAVPPDLDNEHVRSGWALIASYSCR
jgi:hypothetical protein